MLFAYHKPVREIEVISSPQLSDFVAGGLTLQNPPSMLSANNSGFTHEKGDFP